jgi:hypothetical protein
MKVNARYQLLLICALAAYASSARAADNCVKAKCEEIIYFNNAAHDTSIGWISTCPGTKGKQGKSSRFREVDPQTITVCSNNGKIPCRVDPSRCMAIPDPDKPLPLSKEQ